MARIAPTDPAAAIGRTKELLDEVERTFGSIPNLFRTAAASEATLESMLVLFAARVLSFDIAAARHYAVLATKARATGKGFPTPDGYIAAIAAAHGFAVASRDTSAFTAAGLTVIDPWSTAA